MEPKEVALIPNKEMFECTICFDPKVFIFKIHGFDSYKSIIKINKKLKSYNQSYKNQVGKLFNEVWCVSDCLVAPGCLLPSACPL